MQVKTYLFLDRDEIRSAIPYGLIAETRFGSRWNTMRRKRRWKEEFTESERDYAETLFRLAHKWYCVTGVPDEVKMRAKTLGLWQRLGEFCASL